MNIVNRMVTVDDLYSRRDYANTLPKLKIRTQLLIDMDNIANGVFSPLTGFMTEEEVNSVVEDMYLPSGYPWTIPIPLTLDQNQWDNVKVGEDYVMSDMEGKKDYGIIKVSDKYIMNLENIAVKVFKTGSKEHYGVSRMYDWGKYAIGGEIEVFNRYVDEYSSHMLSPRQTREIFKNMGWRTVVAFQTRNVPHRGHEWIQKTALSSVDGLFINPLVGDKKKGDYKDHIVFGSYEILVKNYFPKNTVLLAPLRTMMRYAGPREAIFHALIRKNYGCTHFIVGRDHAGVGNYYGPYEAQEIFTYFPDLGITPVFFKEFYWCNKCDSMVTDKICPHSIDDRIVIKGTLIRDLINHNEEVNTKIMRREVAEYLIKEHDIFI
jgi:sulfate adenylyltransferase